MHAHEDLTGSRRRGRALAVGAAAAGLGAAWALFPRPTPPPAAPATVDLRAVLAEEGLAAALHPAVRRTLDGPMGPGVDAELRRMAIAEVVRAALAGGERTFDVAALGDPDGGWGSLDPQAAVGIPRDDGNAALRDLRPVAGPLLVRAAGEDQADLLAACVVRGAWCLVVDPDADVGGAWREAVAAVGDAGRAGPGGAAALVDRVGRALPAGSAVLWLAPAGPDRVRVAGPTPAR